MRHPRASYLLPLALLLALLPVSPAHADAVVTVCNSDRGTGGTNLASAIQTGGRIIFKCPANSTIQMSTTHQINRAITIDGGLQITLLEGKESMFAAGPSSAPIELRNLKFRDTKNAIIRQSAKGDPALIIAGSEFTNTDAPFRLQNGAMTIRDSVFTNSGGTVVSTVDRLIIERSKFVGTKGIAIFHIAPDRPLTVVDSEFSDNSSGALMIGAGSSNNLDQVVEITRSIFTNNGRDEKNPTGGAVFGAVLFSCNTEAKGCTAKIASSRFSGNRAEQGGAIRIGGAALVSIRNARFENNFATSEGGAIYYDAKEAPNPKIEIRHTVFRSNRATDQGGAIRVAVARVEASAVSFFKNDGGSRGGALYVSETTDFSGGGSSKPSAPVHISRGIFVDNVASEGASAAWIFGGGPSVFANTLIARNRGGGAVAAQNLRIVNSTIKDNEGSGISMTLNNAGGAPIVLRNTIVASNGKQNCSLIFGGRRESPTGAPTKEDLVDEGNNLEFPAASCSTTITVADPQLDTLYLPVAGSNAMGKGDNATCLASPVSARDVYGKVRPQSASCSIGAAEGSLEKEIADRTVGGPNWPGRLDREGTRPPGADGKRPPLPGTGTGTGDGTGACCCCCQTCGR